MIGMVLIGLCKEMVVTQATETFLIVTYVVHLWNNTTVIMSMGDLDLEK